MPPTRQQFDALQARQREMAGRTRAIDLSLLHSAGVRAELLTGHDGWDMYLRQLQGRLEQAEQSMNAYDQRMKEAVVESDLRIAQINWQVCKSRVDTLQEVMELPKQVIETAHRELTLKGAASSSHN